MKTIEVAEGFKIEAYEYDRGYQLVGPGEEESGVTDYGETAVVVVDGKTYEVTVESQESALTEEQVIYLCLDEVPKVEEIEFEDEDEDEDDGDEEDGGEGDEEVVA